MQATLRSTDFVKVQQFINNETTDIRDSVPVVKELSSTELYIGDSHITRLNDSWKVIDRHKNIQFSNKRNAMYYAFLVAYKNTKLIPELIVIDGQLGTTQHDIVRLKYCLAQAAGDSFKIGLYHNKLSEAVARYQKAKHDMHNWMDYAKYIN
jgi:hypothetical protein